MAQHDFKFHSVPISTWRISPKPDRCNVFKFHSVPISTDKKRKINADIRPLNSTLFLYQRVPGSWTASSHFSLNSTLFLYQRRRLTLPWITWPHFKFHSVPISTRYRQPETAWTLNFKFHSVPISTKMAGNSIAVNMPLNSTLFLYQRSTVWRNWFSVLL